MDVLNEFELKYFDCKELLEGLKQKLNDLVEDAVDEKTMDERAKKKVDELWENSKIARREGSIRSSTESLDDIETPETRRIAEMFEFPKEEEADANKLISETEDLFRDTVIGQTTALLKQKVEPKLTNKPKKRAVNMFITQRRTKKDTEEPDQVTSKLYNSLGSEEEPSENVSLHDQEEFFSKVLGKETFEQLGDGPYSTEGLSMTKDELFSLHPGRRLDRNLRMYLLEKIFSFHPEASLFPRGLCVFDLSFSLDYQSQVLNAKNKTTAFHAIVKDYVKRLRAKPKVLVLLVEFEGRRFISVVSKIWIEEHEYTEDIKHFKDTPVALILDPLKLFTPEAESLLRKMIQSLADFMNGLTESPSCLQKVPIHQLILRTAQSSFETDIMFLVQLAAVLANPNELFEAGPTNLYRVDWIGADTCKHFREYIIKHLSKLFLCQGDTKATEGIHKEFQPEVSTIVREKSPSSQFDESRFLNFLAQVGLDQNGVTEEELEKLRVEFYYVN